MTPIIGISTYHQNADWRGWSEEGALLPWTYVTSIQDNGGVPVLLPPVGDTAEAEAVIGRLDGVVIAGGTDVNPALYDSPAHDKTEAIAPDRDTWELALAEAALKLGLPILGICRGMQIINVASGGTLHLAPLRTQGLGVAEQTLRRAGITVASMVPSVLSATPFGARNDAAEPMPSAEPAVVEPASVETRPAGVIFRISLLSTSPTYTLPLASTAIPLG